DGFHQSLHTNNRNVFTHAERLGENDQQTRDQISQDALHGEADTDADHASKGEQWHDIYANRANSDESREEHDQELDDTREEHAHGRLHLAARKPAAHEFADPSRSQAASDDNQDCAEKVRTLIDDISSDLILPFHRYSDALWSVSRCPRNNEFAVLLAITALLCAGCVTPPQAELHR